MRSVRTNLTVTVVHIHFYLQAQFKGAGESFAPRQPTRSGCASRIYSHGFKNAPFGEVYGLYCLVQRTSSQRVLPMNVTARCCSWTRADVPIIFAHALSEITMTQRAQFTSLLTLQSFSISNNGYSSCVGTPRWAERSPSLTCKLHILQDLLIYINSGPYIKWQ
jgi:hypothetical protein